MIAGTERIDIRIHEHHDAHFLIVLQKMPEHRHRSKSCAEYPEEQAQTNSCNKHHAKENRKKHKRRAKIRLFQNEQKRYTDIGGNRGKICNRIDLPAALFKHSSERNDHDKFRELRRLYADRSECDPALRAERRLPDEHNQYEQDKVEHVEMVAVTLQDLVVEIHQKCCKRNVDNDGYALPLNEPDLAYWQRELGKGI